MIYLCLVPMGVKWLSTRAIRCLKNPLNVYTGAHVFPPVLTLGDLCDTNADEWTLLKVGDLGRKTEAEIRVARDRVRVALQQGK